MDSDQEYITTLLIISLCLEWITSKGWVYYFPTNHIFVFRMDSKQGKYTTTLLIISLCLEWITSKGWVNDYSTKHISVFRMDYEQGMSILLLF